jgi:hypothetical protein
MEKFASGFNRRYKINDQLFFVVGMWALLLGFVKINNFDFDLAQRVLIVD